MTNLNAFYNGVTSLADEGRTVNGVYLDFGKVFDPVSCNIIVRDKLTKYRLRKGTVD